MKRRHFLAASAGAVAIGNWRVPVSGAQARLDDRVRIVTGLRAGLQSLGWIGAESGIFRRNGLEVTFPNAESGGPEAAAGLIRGEWEFANTGSSPLIQGVLDGHDTVILFTPTGPTASGNPVLVRPGTSEPSQLLGTRIGVLSETGQNTIALQVALRAWHVTATLVPLGTNANIYAALGARTIDAGVLSPDFRFLGPREFGLNVIETPGTGFSAAAVGCTRRLIAANRPLVTRLVRAYVETIHFFKTERAAVIPLLRQFLRFKDRRAVEDAYEFYAPLFQPLPRPAAEGIQKLLVELALKQPAAAQLTLASVADQSVLDELERSGYVRSLYKR